MNVNDFDFKRFFDLSPDLLCIAGYDGFFKKVNPAVSKLLEYSEDELYARPINDFIFEEDKETTSRVRKSITKSNTLFNFENRYVTKSGEIVWLSWTSQPVMKDELVFAIAKNVTHRKRLESERLTLIDDITKINNELKQFALATSHDLRSPLSSLMAVFELLDISKINDEETLLLIDILKSTGTNLKDSLNNFVQVLSEKKHDQPKPEDVYFEKSLGEVTQSINTLIKTSNTTIHSDFTSVGKIRFNKAYMDSVILNLITNAIKYSKPDYPPVISIYSEITDGAKQLIVADNGLGFDMEKVRGRIFGINQTFHNHSDSKGVGLYLVHSHITSLGGKIAVESKVNEGTRFIISFKE